MKIPEVGTFRHLVTWQAPSTDRDILGQVNAEQAYTTLGTRRASLVTTQAQEQVIGKKPEGTSTYLVTQRYLADLAFNCQMVFQGRTFQITGINNLEEQNRFQEITVVEIRK